MSVLVWILTLAAASVGGWPVTWLVLRAAGGARDSAATAGREERATRTNDDAETERPAVAPVENQAPDGTSAGTQDLAGVLRGGAWIGLLERLAVAGSILLGYPAGIAVVVAVKGLGRFPELRHNPAASERFIIGTLASLIWAAAMAAAGAALLAVVH